MESFNQRRFDELTGKPTPFVQDNHSKSGRNVLRGLHYQLERPQGKLVRVIAGEIFDVAVDIRRRSPTFGRWVGVVLSAQNRKQIWVPPGFAHGFLALSDDTEVLYKTTDYWVPEAERCIAWNDPELAVTWPAGIEPQLSPKDREGKLLSKADLFN
jgi:dTDP-4-dehydrorhamnose 3,5-epimerase